MIYLVTFILVCPILAFAFRIRDTDNTALGFSSFVGALVFFVLLSNRGLEYSIGDNFIDGFKTVEALKVDDYDREYLYDKPVYRTKADASKANHYKVFILYLLFVSPYASFLIIKKDLPSQDHNSNVFLVILKAIAAIMLFGCLLDNLPYIYFNYLRLVVMSVAIWQLSEEGGKRNNWILVILYMGIAFLFNVLEHVELIRPQWQVIDIVVGLMFIYSIVVDIKKPKIEAGNDRRRRQFLNQ
ncbi:MAG: DUF6804 family protein [Bacteroidota bacterium]